MLENSRIIQIRNLIFFLENENVSDAVKIEEIKHKRDCGVITDDDGLDLVLFYDLKSTKSL